MRLLLIHGRSQGGKDPLELKGEWEVALASGLASASVALPCNTKVDFPFYGDRLDQFTAQFDVAVNEVATEKGVGGNDEFADFARRLAEEAQVAKGITDDEVRADMLARHGARATEKRPENWEWVQSIISILDNFAPRAAEKTFSMFLRDVFLYTRRKPVRRAIDQIVTDELSDEPTVVVGHSLGSVVGYNVLASEANKSVRSYITLGSPLGIRGISSSLDTPWKNVGGPNGWFNAYDDRDVVALNPLDSQYFAVSPAVVNDASLKNDTDNHHGIVSYLNKSVVATRIVAGYS
jgi:hypothetical protein